MGRENGSKYRKKKFPLLSCAMAIELMTTFLFAFPFVSFRMRRFTIVQPLLTTC